MIPLSQRKLVAVRLENMKFQAMPPDGSDHMTANCELHLQAFDGAENGPAAFLMVGVPFSDTTPLSAIENSLLGAAHEMIKSLAAYSLDELRAAFEKDRSADRKVTRECYVAPAERSAA